MADSLLVRLKALAQRVLRRRWGLVVVVFVVGLVLRWPMVEVSHQEGDEAVYMSLVFELEQGHGYTLQKSPLVTRGVLDPNQYDRPLFYHPPGGIALFWLMHQVFGNAGFPAAQIFSFALFFWAMLGISRGLGITRSDLGLFLVALLAACNPILAHATTKYWLDGPLLAFATLGAALFLRSFVLPAPPPLPRKGRAKSRQPIAPPSNESRAVLLAVLAGVVLGYASLIKLTAFTMIPGVLLLAWATTQPQPRRFLVHGACFVLAALVVQAPWEIWQWAVVGSPFPQWAGKPSPSLVASNDYVRFLTLERSPWMYITKTPVVLTTILPSLALLASTYVRGNDADLADETRKTRRTAMACFLWLVIVVAFNTFLGFNGYSKLLRYAILMVPATILIPALLVSQPTAFAGFARRLRLPLFALLAAGVLLEVGLGIHAAFRVPHSLIAPLTGF